MRYDSLKKHYIDKSGVIISKSATPRKMSFLMIIVISLLFTFHNYYVTTVLSFMPGDRMNYVQNFDYGRESPSLGLTGIMLLIQSYNGDFNTLLYYTTFVCMFITLLAYRYSREATPNALLVLMLSQYIQMTYDGLKQSYASAFATLMLVILLKEHTIKRDITCIILIVMAILFHVSSFILIPIFLWIRFKSHFNSRKLLLPLLIASIAFIQLLFILSYVLSSFVPVLSEKIDDYFFSDNEDQYSAAMSIIKGVPFYIIAYIGYKYRDKLVNKIYHYDGYCLIAMLCAFMFFMNVYNAWMSRFTYYFQFVSYIFWGLILLKLPHFKIYNVAIILITGIITYRLFIMIF